MSRSRAIALGTAVIVIAGTFARDVSAEPRAVIELFTSQGCSSCPPADRLLGKLKDDPSLIAVSLPIHYWDYLGWKDTLADPRHTARQKAYSHVRGDRNVYTPQVVVNGAVQALGSDRAAVEQAVETAADEGKGLSVALELAVADGKVLVSAGEGGDGHSGEVWLWGVATSVPVAIRRGENNGRTITYFNVVRRWIKLGDWTGAKRSWTVPLADIKGDRIDAVAAIIQSGSATKPGPILGADVEPLN
ncbi:MAG: DUF1223 domain-containing protein [Xanthobacteraceae bacterium]